MWGIGMEGDNQPLPFEKSKKYITISNSRYWVWYQCCIAWIKKKEILAKKSDERTSKQYNIYSGGKKILFIH